MGIRLGEAALTDLGLEVVGDLFLFHVLNIYSYLLA